MYWTVLCYHHYLVSLLFADLLSLHLVTFLMFSILVHITFLAADACLSWSLPFITEQQVSPHRLPMQYWLKNRWPDQGFFKHSPHTNSTSNSVILHNITFCCWFECMRTLKKKWRRKGSHSSSVSGLNRLVWLQTWKKSDGLVHCSVKNAAVVCENYRERVTQIWTSPGVYRLYDNSFLVSMIFADLLSLYLITFRY